MQTSTFTTVQVKQFIETLNKLDHDHPYVVRHNKKDQNALFSASASRDGKLKRHQITEIACAAFEILRRLSLTENSNLLRTFSTGLINYKNILNAKNNQSKMPKKFESLQEKISALTGNTHPLQTPAIINNIASFLSLEDCQKLLSSKPRQPIGKIIGNIITARLSKQKKIEDAYQMLSDSGAASENCPFSANKMSNIQALPLKQRAQSYHRIITNMKTLKWEQKGRLTHLPSNISEWSAVTFIRADQQCLKKLPSSIGRLSKLDFLSVQFNQIKSLPDAIGNISSLGHLDLTGNPLTSLPRSMEKLVNLRVLNVAGTQLKKETLEWVKKALPQCKVIT